MVFGGQEVSVLNVVLLLVFYKIKGNYIIFLGFNFEVDISVCYELYFFFYIFFVGRILILVGQLVFFELRKMIIFQFQGMNIDCGIFIIFFVISINMDMLSNLVNEI